ncbi:hypothetical protein JTB14_012590 [Gonioctena quinquepunctata]|nr:hypothetical protein JTB14_012590 [Gonioctena quinquepunctata]
MVQFADIRGVCGDGGGHSLFTPYHVKSEDGGGLSQGPSHAFRCKTFKKPRPCHLCHQPILNEGSCCRVCKYVCHKVCESKESNSSVLEEKPGILATKPYRMVERFSVFGLTSLSSFAVKMGIQKNSDTGNRIRASST